MWASTRTGLALLACATGVAALTLGGCAKEQAAAPREWTPGAVADAKSELLAMRNAPEDLLTPAVRGGTDGLELIWFVALDQPDDQGQSAVARALAAYVSQPLPITDATRRRLEANGVRMVRVPLADVPMIESMLRRVGARNRDWIGWALDWREAFSGRSIPAGGALVIDGERERTPGGALRLLTRCWTAPATEVRATPGETRADTCLRLELVAQLRGGAAAGEADPRSLLGLDLLAGGESALDARSQGRLLPCISLEAALEPGYAYILTAEQPDISWGSTQGSARPRAAAEEETGLTKMETRPVAMVAPSGPLAIAPPTVGEAMLMNLSRLEHEPAARAVIALIPAHAKSCDHAAAGCAAEVTSRWSSPQRGAR